MPTRLYIEQQATQTPQLPFVPSPGATGGPVPTRKVGAAYTMALEVVAERTNLLGAESAGEQKAATSTRRDRTVMQSFMVSAEEKLSHRSDDRTKKLQNPTAFCADSELGLLLYRNSEDWARGGGTGGQVEFPR